MVDLKGQYLKIKDEVDAGIQAVIDSSAFINGPAVNAFRLHLSQYLGGTHVVACANGTDALQIALMALGLKPGDEVIVPAFTYVSSAEVIALLGLTPVMVDVDPLTFNVTAENIRKALTPASKAVIPVHLFDTAGLRDTEESIEAEGIRRTEDLMEKADLIVYVIDPSSGDVPPDDSRVLAVYSRLDLTGSDGSLAFSSVTGEGMDQVIDAIAKRLTDGLEACTGVPRIDSERQRDALIAASDALKDAEQSMQFGYDVVAMYLQSALSSLADLTGETTGEDVLDRLFSSFCLGK